MKRQRRLRGWEAIPSSMDKASGAQSPRNTKMSPRSSTGPIVNPQVPDLYRAPDPADLDLDSQKAAFVGGKKKVGSQSKSNKSKVGCLMLDIATAVILDHMPI